MFLCSEGFQPQNVILFLFCMRGLEILSYKIRLRNRVTQNDVILLVTNLNIFTEIRLSSY